MMSGKQMKCVGYWASKMKCGNAGTRSVLFILFSFCYLTVAARRVIIKGTTEQIALARSLIEEKVMEEIEMREKIQESLDKRSPRKRTGAQYLMLADAIEVRCIISPVVL
jgi:uncharacterized membrane protein